MKQLASDIQQTFEKAGETVSPLAVEEIVLGKQAAQDLVHFLKRKGYQNIAIICDQTTYSIAGRNLELAIDHEGIQVKSIAIPDNEAGDVTADERSLIHTLIQAPKTIDSFIAVGSGTIHDIVRFAAFHRDLPFISFPTAPSVDGFTSAGAPVILHGTKTTVQTKAPIALFADVDLLKSAPQPMVAAGFGDMLGKITSLADWKISHQLADEPYSHTGARLVEESLNNCIANTKEIASKTESGIRILMEALIVSGLVMLALDHSRPASGGEHHVSHWIEMELMKKNKPQILHGAKVGCAAVLLTDTYRKLAKHENLSEFSPDRRDIIQSIYEGLPEGKTLAGWLKSAGGPAYFDEIGVDGESVKNALKHAHTLRERYTGLRIINENETLLKNGLYQ
ncbi:sn-glycerol-1-phosphate dehydrogenase [Bacillus atrophaeus]|uniref:sn-glycerol-1-phosphate dehydrogenase n=1 Tax=Bacillus atrophaeus TaxID=1452 RepID=UPI002280330D|nr:sn-glycerol-1-phosphate dehydrogenase [Bacillus atrophaeus]MCY8463913.1 sn-glycerol-1-phosphate dehydrogenase [Bacillus atrophaeus]MCY8476953.1 sn-glycerol-1-phosphate dehydrogenase [Bacillus atrophaeus]MCY8961480.1 sn-glycerol-1-phosphate dehydrogenase [Bacillus atrophaeus]MCY8965726.1 sn-glycerol-1-phosphate dehydrogenase [Bacillus atrophaeus]MCY9438023.1 sn-glycerol-1-phosphate dehydrogenase [Bacillus atrophaeus]